jgi:lipid II:glycine glycyltransferase (peptidoglycan interpeptide bridge formation enzyme)
MSVEAERWDRELAELASPPPLLQSWGWGQVQRKAGWAGEYLRLTGAMASVLTRKVGPVTEAYVPRGPAPATPQALERLIDWASSRRVARLVIEPEAQEGFADLRALGFRQVAPTQPQHTRIVRLLPRERLLATFRHGRRYNIRAGLKRGVVADADHDAAELARQSHAVEVREAISLPDEGYYELLLTLLPWCRTYTARAPETGEPLATVLVARHGGRAYSLFAGRTGHHSELMGNDIAWWSAIAAAADDGCSDFDLWGIPPPGAGQDHPWHGLGSFKAEFGGAEVAYVGAWEKVLSDVGAKLIGAERKARAYIRGLKRNIP